MAKLFDWTQPIDIRIKESGQKVTHTQRHAVISGQLQKGLLHGPVVMKGIFSNDLAGNCPSVLFDGLGFVGHFVDGVATGICWKGLHGGAWIYGRVDEKGHFTGDTFLLDRTF
jgi:hypothetical protein